MIMGEEPHIHAHAREQKQRKRNDEKINKRIMKAYDEIRIFSIQDSGQDPSTPIWHHGDCSVHTIGYSTIQCNAMQ